MITFDVDNTRFFYRVSGVTINNDSVLLKKIEGRDNWTLPGGQGELLESAIETLKREMLEELGNEIKVNRLLWIVDNFFTGDDFLTREKMSCHKLELYFLMELQYILASQDMTEFPGEDDGFKITFKWHKLDQLNNINLLPSFLQTALKKIPENTEYILHTDELSPSL